MPKAAGQNYRMAEEQCSRNAENRIAENRKKG